MRSLSQFFDWLHDHPWMGWPFQLPPKTQTLKPFFIFRLCVLYGALPWLVTAMAILGDALIPSFLLSQGQQFPQTLFSLKGLSAITSIGLSALFWLGGLWLLWMPNIYYWNRRARILSIAEPTPEAVILPSTPAVNQYKRPEPFVNFGLPRPQMEVCELQNQTASQQGESTPSPFGQPLPPMHPPQKSQNIAAFSESTSPNAPVIPPSPVNPFTLDSQYSENKTLSGALAFAPWNTFKVQPFHTHPSQDSAPNSSNTFLALSPHQQNSMAWVDPVEHIGSLMFYLSGLCLTAVVLLYSAISPVMSAVAQDLKTLHPNLSLHPTPLKKSISGDGPASTSPLTSGIFPTEICCIAQKSSLSSSHFDDSKSLGLQSPTNLAAGNISSEVSLKLPWEVVRQGQRHTIVSLCNAKATCVVFEKRVPDSVTSSQTASSTKLLKLEGLYQENSIQEIRYKTLALPTPFSLETLHDILNPSPESLSPFLSPSENRQLLKALLFKRYFLENVSHIYHLKTPQWEGYQLGSPQKDPWVQVILFETNPKNISNSPSWISLNFGTLAPVHKNPGAKFPQAKAIQQQEIFQIIDTLKPTSDI